MVTIAQDEKYNASQIDERHRDHALFIAYAPADDPKIAIAMIVENAGFGAQRRADRAPRVRLLLAALPERGRHRRCAEGKAPRPDRQAAPDRRSSLATQWQLGGKAAVAASLASIGPATAAP